MIDLRLGDCRTFEDAGLFHALLCDPPYHLISGNAKYDLALTGSGNPRQRRKAAGGGFMGQTWDGGNVAFDPETWAKLAEHLYDGAFGMAFASSRGWHRLACAIEDAGLIIHPTIFGWAYGSGFPKATRIDTAIDKRAGAERQVVREIRRGSVEDAKGRGASYLADPANRNNKSCFGYGVEQVTAPATPLAATWAGHRYGLQALKPALEPIIVFQKPYRGKPIDCITRTGAGALNIDGARIGTDAVLNHGYPGEDLMGAMKGNGVNGEPDYHMASGRWPANFILLDDDAAQALDAQSEAMGIHSAGKARDGSMAIVADSYNASCYEMPPNRNMRRFGDSGGASRFFFRVQEQIDDADPVYYTAKASRRERDAGLDEWKPRDVPCAEYRDAMKDTDSFVSKYPDGSPRPMNKIRNPHPTVKPIQLARYLATLLLPPAEYAPRRILIPFAGVASEMIGAHLAGWDEVIGIERGAEYVEIGQARIAHWCGIPIEAQAQLTMQLAAA